MAPTTTLRVPLDLRDQIARLAEERGTSMLEVVTDAIHRLTRDEWWGRVHEALDGMPADDVAVYRFDSEQFDGAAGDGLGAG